jgi:hypothetical protein
MTVDNKLIVKLATHICHFKVQPRKQDGPVKIAGYELDPDGRTVKTVVRELREAGYLTDQEEKGHRGYYYFLTERAWDQIEPTKPDLFKWFIQDMKDVRFKDHPPHVRWSRLSLSEQKFALSYIGQYLFAFGGTWGNDAQIYPFIPNYVEGQSEFKVSGNYEIMVGSFELTEQVKAWRREQNIERVYRTQLFEGLVHCGIVPKGTPKFMSVGEQGFPLDGDYEGGKTFFSAEPDKWQEELGDRINGTLSQLQKLQTLLGHLFTVQAGVHSYGGWEKFLADFRQAAVEAVDKPEPAPAEEAKKE